MSAAGAHAGLLAKIDGEMREHEQRLDELRGYRADLTGSTLDAGAVRLPAFLTEKHPPLDWLLGGLIAPGTMGMFIADTSVGKTTALVQICLSLAAGQHVLGYRVERPVKTLMVVAEGARSPFQNRVRTAAQSLGMTADLDWFIQPPDFKEFEIGSARLERLIMDERPEFTVLDTLQHFFRGDENDAKDWARRVLHPTKALARASGSTFVLVHHTKQNYRQFTWPHRGTSAMAGDSDFYLFLDSVDGAGNEARRDFWVKKQKYGAAGYRRSWEFNADGAIFSEVL